MKKHIVFFIFFINTLLFCNEGNFWTGDNTINAKGDKLTMYDKGQKIVLLGNTSVKRSDLQVLADTMEIWQKDEKFNGLGNVKTEKIFENGNTVNSISNKIFYNEKSKLIELFDILNLDYFLKNENKTLNVIGEYLKIKEEDGFRKATFEKVFSMKLPFEEKNKKGINILKADKIKATTKIDDETYNFAVLENNVVLNRNYENGEFVKIQAYKMTYSKKEHFVKFEKVREIQSFQLEENTTYYVYCDEIFWDLDENIGALTGKPVIFKKIDDSYQITSNFVKINKNKQEVLFTENPIARQTDEQGVGAYKAENILYYLETKLIKMFGNVDIDFLPNKKNKNK